MAGFTKNPAHFVAVVSLVVVVVSMKVMMASVAVSSEQRQAHVGPSQFDNYAKRAGKIKFRRLIGYFSGAAAGMLVDFVVVMVVVVVVVAAPVFVKRPALMRSF